MPTRPATSESVNPVRPRSLASCQAGIEDLADALHSRRSAALSRFVVPNMIRESCIRRLAAVKRDA